MTWKKVTCYSFEFSTAEKGFWLHYSLEGDPGTVRLPLDAQEFSAAARMFDSATSIGFDTRRQCFSTEPRLLRRPALIPQPRAV